MEAPGGSPTAHETRTDQELLRQYLADRDVPCPACRYNIRQLRGNSCPECGRELKLTIGVVGLANTWIAALVAALVPAGCGIPFIILLLVAMSHEAPIGEIASEPEGVLFLLLVFYSMCSVVFSTLLLVMRQRFMRLKVPVQGGIATALVLAAVLYGLGGLVLVGSLASL